MSNRKSRWFPGIKVRFSCHVTNTKESTLGAEIILLLQSVVNFSQGRVEEEATTKYIWMGWRLFWESSNRFDSTHSIWFCPQNGLGLVLNARDHWQTILFPEDFRLHATGEPESHRWAYSFMSHLCWSHVSLFPVVCIVTFMIWRILKNKSEAAQETQFIGGLSSTASMTIFGLQHSVKLGVHCCCWSQLQVP